jgi:protein arginine N-methyltransferase 1
VTKEELDFSSQVTVTMSRKDYVHALVVYFDVVFSKCQNANPTKFSTGPADKYTHWKQTVFYIDQELIASEGDKIDVFMKVNRNEKNPRDLDILIQSKFKGGSKSIDQQRLYRLR